jgi:hypothetical protein
VTFVPAVVADRAEPLSITAQSPAAVIFVDLAQGAPVEIGAGACPALVTRTLRALRP